MLSYVLSFLSVARHAVALTLVAGAAATTMVAGAVDQNTTRYQQQTVPTPALPSPSTAPEPAAKYEVTRTGTPATNLEALVADCLSKYEAAKNTATGATAASEGCRRAIEASGMNSNVFWTKFAPKPQTSTAPAKPSTKPSTYTNIEALVKDCFAKYEAANQSTTGPAAATEACHRAIDASGLNATEFWAKFGKPSAPRSEPKPSTSPKADPTQTTALSQLTRYCLTLHAALTSASSHEQVERTTTVCNQAIAESKLTPTQFWSKFSTHS
jgi:hypothetical protein